MHDDTLLAILHRGRPATIADAAQLAHLDEAAARGAVEALRERGLLGGSGDELAYPDPAAWASERVTARSSQLRRDAQSALDDIEGVIAELPRMLRQFSIGETTADPVPVITRHGPHASEDLWFDNAPHESGTLFAVLPEVSRFLEPDPDRAARFGRALAGKTSVRVIIPTSAVDEPAAVRSIEHYSSFGVEYRTLDSPPSWFWVDGDQLALPFEWGEGAPTSVLGVRNAALGGMAVDYFERLWRQAEPILPAEHPWTPLLTLMRQGITLESASRSLGINPRTGRRRIAAAMEHYRATTLFALGVAWAADGLDLD